MSMNNVRNLVISENVRHCYPIREGEAPKNCHKNAIKHE